MVAINLERMDDDMGNFAVAASDEIIRQGNELLNELSKDGVKKEIALSRLFELARENVSGHALRQGGVDVEALDAALTNIRTMFLSAITGREQIVIEKDTEIAEIKALKEKMEADLRSQIAGAKEAKEQAEKVTVEYQKSSQQAEKEAAAAKEQADTANRLVAEKQKINDMLSSKLSDAETKIENYDALQKKLEDAQKKIDELNHTIAENKKSAEYEKSSLQAEMDRKLLEKEKDAELNLERMIAAKDKEKAEELLELQKQNAALQVRIDMLQEVKN